MPFVSMTLLLCYLPSCQRIILRKMRVTIEFLKIIFCIGLSFCQKPSESVIKEYCNLKCKKITGEVVENTVCQYNCEIANNCKNSLQVYELNDVDRQLILDWHNHLRNMVALGKDKRGGNDKATNMMVLNYEKEHEITSYCWGLRCIFNHDKCRRTPKFEKCGQNLYIMTVITNQEFQHTTKAELIKLSLVAWYEEIVLTNRQVLEAFRGSHSHREAWGHYTQLVWHDTATVGCTIVYFKEGEQHKQHVLCNYGPAGNFVHRPVYDFGPSASKCPGEVNDMYKGLCGRLDILSENRTKIDFSTQAPLRVNIDVFVVLAIHYLWRLD